MPDTPAEARLSAVLDGPRAELYDAVSRWGAGANPEEARQAIARFEVAAIEVGREQLAAVRATSWRTFEGYREALDRALAAEAEVTRLRGVLGLLEPVLRWADGMIVADGTCGVCGYAHAFLDGHMEDCDGPKMLEAMKAVRAPLDEGSEGGD